MHTSKDSMWRGNWKILQNFWRTKQGLCSTYICIDTYTHINNAYTYTQKSRVCLRFCMINSGRVRDGRHAIGAQHAWGRLDARCTHVQEQQARARHAPACYRTRMHGWSRSRSRPRPGVHAHGDKTMMWSPWQHRFD